MTPGEQYGLVTFVVIFVVGYTLMMLGFGALLHWMIGDLRKTLREEKHENDQADEKGIRTLVRKLRRRYSSSHG